MSIHLDTFLRLQLEGKKSHQAQKVKHKNLPDIRKRVTTITVGKEAMLSFLPLQVWEKQVPDKDCSEPVIFSDLNK